MIEKVYIAQSEEDWLRFRKTRIGASEVGAVLGFNPYRTALDIFHDKTNPDIERIDNPKMRAGRMLEDAVASWWMEETGLACEKDLDSEGRQRVRIHPQHDFLVATLDRIIPPQLCKPEGVLEIKTASEFAEKDWEEGPPLSYHAQIQAQMSATGYSWGEFALLRGGWDFRRFIHERDDEFIELMNRELIHFWKDHVLKRVPPEPTSEREVETLFPKSVPEKVVEVNEEVFSHYLELVELRKRMEELKQQDQKLVEQFKVLMRDAEALTYQGRTLATWKTTNGFDEKRFRAENRKLYNQYLKKEIDRTRLKNDYPEIYREYVDKSGLRKFTLKKN